MHFVKVKGILSPQNGMNLYRGCSHGCIYCDSRSACYQMKHEFEGIEVKENALELLEDALRRKRKKCMIGTGAMSDPYIPIEEDLQYTKKALELIFEYGFGATLITKSSRVLRDIDLLAEINKKTKCVVQMTMTTYDETLCKKLEPGVSGTKERFETLMKLKEAGIPTVVWLTPILPHINDTKENIEGILDYCIQADVKGIICFNMGVTMREGNREFFYENLDKSFPGLKEKYSSEYGNKYVLQSNNNKILMELFRKTCKQYDIMYNAEKIFTYLHKFEEKEEYQQLKLF